MPERPLSPHLSVYKFKYTLATSILNRLAGLILSLGFFLFVYWLVALAAGARAYAQARALLSLGVQGRLCRFACRLRLSPRRRRAASHLGYRTRARARQRPRSAWIVAFVSVVVTALLIYSLLRPGAYAR
jgi:succinate dehydrogenase / fumarate reductase cytochrome b subunit